MPDNGDLLGRIFNAATGVWALVCMVAVALFKAWPLVLGRFNERQRDTAEEKAADWERLRVEIARLHEQLRCCQQERGEWMRRAITAEATLQGYGEVREIEQLTRSMKRLRPEEGDK